MTGRPYNLMACRGATALAVLFVLAGCIGGPTQLPPISNTPTEVLLPGKFVWCDLASEDPTIATAFYRAMFGWDFEPLSSSYIEVRRDGRAIAGVMRQSDKDDSKPESLWICSLSVLNVQTAMQLAMAEGGQVLEGPFDSARGGFAVVRDPVGATLVVLRSKQGDLPDVIPAVGDWLWIDLFTRDIQTAERFYAALVGYETDTITLEREMYTVFRHAGRARAGVVELPWKQVEDNWLPYIRVADTKQAVDRALSLGGKVLLQKGDTAVLVDPMGAAFGIQALEPEGG